MADSIYKEKIDTFYGGVPDDSRMQNKELSQMAQHFDLWTSPKRLVPFRGMVPDENTTYNIILFLYANSTLYGLGIVVGFSKAKIYYKASDALTGSWTAATSGEDGGGARATVCFIEFHNYIYGGAAGTRIWSWGDLTGAPAFTATAYSGAGAPSAQGLKTTDDLLLIPCTNLMAKKDGAGSGPTNAWTIGITIPSDYTITDQCEYGDKVAIAMRPAVGYGGSRSSKVFIWDKVSADPDAVIDFGEGDLYYIEEVAGELVGISSVGGLSGFSIKPKAVVSVWNGGSKALPKVEIEGDAGTTLNMYGNHTKIKDGTRVKFAMKVTIDGVTYNQMWAVGRKTANYPLALAGDILVDNDTALTGNIDGAAKLGSYYFIAHNQDGSVNRTRSSAPYWTTPTVTSLYISQKLNGEAVVRDAARRKKVLVMGGLEVRKMVTGESASLYARVDGATSWTLIKTYSYGDDTPGVGAEWGRYNDTTDFPTYKEIELKAISNGGAEITGIPFAWKFAGADIVSE